MAISKTSKAFMGCAVAEGLLLLIDTIYSLSTQDRCSASSTNTNCRSPEDTWFYWFLIIGVIFFVWFCIESILQENKFGLIAFEAAALFITGREVWDYAELDGPTSWDTWRLSLVCVAQFMWIVFGKRVYDNMGWLFFNRIGSDVTIQRCFTDFQGLNALLHIDFELQFLLLYTALFYIVLVQNETDINNRQLVVGIVCSLITLFWSVGWIWLGVVSTQEEKTQRMQAFVLMALVTPALGLAYLLDVSNTYIVSCVDTNCGIISKAELFKGVIVYVFSIFARVGVVVFARRVQANFNSGLKEVYFEGMKLGDYRQKAKVFSDGSTSEFPNSNYLPPSRSSLSDSASFNYPPITVSTTPLSHSSVNRARSQPLLYD